MWIVLYVCASEENAKKLSYVLAENKIISKIRSAGNSIEVLVPQAELSSAQELIIEEELF